MALNYEKYTLADKEADKLLLLIYKNLIIITPKPILKLPYSWKDIVYLRSWRESQAANLPSKQKKKGEREKAKGLLNSVSIDARQTQSTFVSLLT